MTVYDVLVHGFRTNETSESFGKLTIDSQNVAAAAAKADSDWVSFD